MFNRLVILLVLNLQVFTAVAYASNDLDKWNSEKGRVARSAMKDKIATTTYKEMPNHVDSSYRSTANGGKVLRELETSAEIKGSRVGVTIEALKTVDKTSAAKKWAKEFGKGGIRFTVGAILIEAAMQEMLDGIGWIIDEGGKVTKKPDPNSSDNLKYTSKYIYRSGSSTDYSAVSALKRNFEDTVRTNQSFAGAVFTSGSVAKDFCIYSSDCLYANYTAKYTQNNNNFSYNFLVSRSSNPDYNPDYKIQTDPVLQPEMIEKIRDYFENPQSPASKDLLIEQAEKPRGKASIMWSDDPSSEQTIYSDNKNTAEKVLNSDDPVGDGLTKSTPKINDGTTVESETTTNTETNTNVNEHTVTNPDGSTTTTGTNVSNTTNVTNNNFDLPAFCDYASKLCEWLDWTREEPEEEQQTEEQNINNRGIFDREFETEFNLEGSCPPDYTFTWTNKYMKGSYTLDLSWFCMIFTFLGYPLVFVSHCIGVWIFYEVASRKEFKV